ncbi:hypothetical protein HPB47_005096 [Ixodes persulcatus]|uniref:Uncharacterized protein n=1 Tax=Ixodes persulcatus TaxID=34615 RepID=A0AC60PEP1_IXOPE|nr:hypothetical protein HPB47_005096 [Ixodes persulcatus]
MPVTLSKGMGDDELLGLAWSLQQQRIQFNQMEVQIQTMEAEADTLEEQLHATNFTIAAVLARELTKVPRERTVYVRPDRWFEETLPRMGEQHFRACFRVSSTTFRYLVDVCRPSMVRQDTSMKSAMTVEGLPDGHDGITEMTDATEGPSSLKTYTRKRCRWTVDDVEDVADTLETGTPSQDEGLMNGEGNAADDATMDEHLEDHGWTLPGRRRRPKPPRGSHLPRFHLVYRHHLTHRPGMENILKLKELETDEEKNKVNVYRATTAGA